VTEITGGTILKFKPNEIPQGQCVIYSSGGTTFAVCRADMDTIQVYPVHKQIEYTKDKVVIERKGEEIKIKE